MFLTLLSVAVDVYNGLRQWQRTMRLLKLIQRHLRHTSIVLRQLGHDPGQDSERISRLVSANPAGWLENVLLQEKNKAMLSISPKVCLSMDGWVSYLASQDITTLPAYPASDHTYVLFEMSQVADTQDYLQRSFSMPITHRVKLIDCCEPLAWRSGLPFGIVAWCSVQNLTRLIDAHIQGHLCLDEMLKLHQLITVEIEGFPTPLLDCASHRGSQTVSSNRSPWGSEGSIRSLLENSTKCLQKAEEIAASPEPALLEQSPLTTHNSYSKAECDMPNHSATRNYSKVGCDTPYGSTAHSHSEAGCALPDNRAAHNHSDVVCDMPNHSATHNQSETGPVQLLLRTLADTDTVQHNLGELDCGIVDDDTTDLYEGSNESLASSVADLREIRGEVDHFAQTVEEVMTLNGDVISEMMDSLAIEAAGEGVGGESLSGPLEELAPETLTPCKRRRTMRTKPPNVLVYCGKKDSTRQFEAVKAVLGQCLNLSRYAIYQLKHDQIMTQPWSENTALLVLSSEKAYDGADQQFMHHFTHGGTVLSLGCAFDDLFVERIQTNTNLSVMSLTAFKQWRDMKIICGCHVYKNTDTLVPDVTLKTLADNMGYPVILEANHDLSSGVAILSQVLLEKDPMELAVNPEVFAMLKKSNSARFGMLQHVMAQLGLDTDRSNSGTLTFSILLAKKQVQKDSFLRSIQPRLNDGFLRSRKLSLQFVDSEKEVPSSITSEVLPLVTNAASAEGKYGFHVENYLKSLETEQLGQVVIYADVMATTMNVIDILMFPVPKDIGLVAVAQQQTSGVGRGGNMWLSPAGCAMFSLLVRVGTGTQLGQRVSFLQHMASLAVVQGITTIRGYEKLDLKLKWPNDIYYGSAMKLGGVVVSTSVMQTTIHANIGIGFNVDNKDPTICLNDLVRQYNMQHGTVLPNLTCEVVIARTINWLEILIKSFEKNGPGKFLRLYYKHWLHGDALVQLSSKSGPKLRVVGLDDYGYLLVETPEGTTQSLHPDGNSFDMMKGLIIPKMH